MCVISLHTNFRLKMGLNKATRSDLTLLSLSIQFSKIKKKLKSTSSVGKAPVAVQCLSYHRISTLFRYMCRILKDRGRICRTTKFFGTATFFLPTKVLWTLYQSCCGWRKLNCNQHGLVRFVIKLENVSIWLTRPVSIIWLLSLFFEACITICLAIRFVHFRSKKYWTGGQCWEK